MFNTFSKIKKVKDTQLQTYGASLAMVSHSVTCHPTQVNAPHLKPSQYLLLTNVNLCVACVQPIPSIWLNGNIFVAPTTLLHVRQWHSWPEGGGNGGEG